MKGLSAGMRLCPACGHETNEDMATCHLCEHEIDLPRIAVQRGGGGNSIVLLVLLAVILVAAVILVPRFMRRGSSPLPATPSPAATPAHR